MYSDTNKTNFRAASTIRSSSLERRQVKKDLGVSGEISKFEKNMPLSARVVLGGTSNRLYSTLYKW